MDSRISIIIDEIYDEFIPTFSCTDSCALKGGAKLSSGGSRVWSIDDDDAICDASSVAGSTFVKPDFKDLEAIDTDGDAVIEEATPETFYRLDLTTWKGVLRHPSLIQQLVAPREKTTPDELALGNKIYVDQRAPKPHSEPSPWGDPVSPRVRHQLGIENDLLGPKPRPRPDTPWPRPPKKVSFEIHPTVESRSPRPKPQQPDNEPSPLSLNHMDCRWLVDPAPPNAPLTSPVRSPIFKAKAQKTVHFAPSTIPVKPHPSPAPIKPVYPRPATPDELSMVLDIPMESCTIPRQERSGPFPRPKPKPNPDTGPRPHPPNDTKAGGLAFFSELRAWGISVGRDRSNKPLPERPRPKPDSGPRPKDTDLDPYSSGPSPRPDQPPSSNKEDLHRRSRRLRKQHEAPRTTRPQYMLGSTIAAGNDSIAFIPRGSSKPNQPDPTFPRPPTPTTDAQDSLFLKASQSQSHCTSTRTLCAPSNSSDRITIPRTKPTIQDNVLASNATHAPFTKPPKRPNPCPPRPPPIFRDPRPPYAPPRPPRPDDPRPQDPMYFREPRPGPPHRPAPPAPGRPPRPGRIKVPGSGGEPNPTPEPVRPPGRPPPRYGLCIGGVPAVAVVG